MKTTVDLDEEMIRLAMELYGVKTKKRIIEMGLRELIRDERRSRLAAAFGSQPELGMPRRRR